MTYVHCDVNSLKHPNDGAWVLTEQAGNVEYTQGAKRTVVTHGRFGNVQT